MYRPQTNLIGKVSIEEVSLDWKYSNLGGSEKYQLKNVTLKVKNVSGAEIGVYGHGLQINIAADYHIITPGYPTFYTIYCYTYEPLEAGEVRILTREYGTYPGGFLSVKQSGTQALTLKVIDSSSGEVVGERTIAENIP